MVKQPPLRAPVANRLLHINTTGLFERKLGLRLSQRIRGPPDCFPAPRSSRAASIVITGLATNNHPRTNGNKTGKLDLSLWLDSACGVGFEARVSLWFLIGPRLLLAALQPQVPLPSQ
jgi:hypothetical protein